MLPTDAHFLEGTPKRTTQKEPLLDDVLSHQHIGHGVRQRLHQVKGHLVSAVLMAPSTSAAECHGSQASSCGGTGELLDAAARVQSEP